MQGPNCALSYAMLFQVHMKANRVFRVFLPLLLLLALISCSLHAAEGEKNTFIVCENGLEMFHWDLHFLSEAKYSVEIIACFLGGDIACELLTAIEARLHEVPDLQVYILASPTLLASEDWAIIRHLQDEFFNNFHIAFSTQIAKFLPDITTIDNHVKLLVVDETYFRSGATHVERHHLIETMLPRDTCGEDRAASRPGFDKPHRKTSGRIGRSDTAARRHQQHGAAKAGAIKLAFEPGDIAPHQRLQIGVGASGSEPLILAHLW